MLIRLGGKIFPVSSISCLAVELQEGTWDNWWTVEFRLHNGDRAVYPAKFTLFADAEKLWQNLHKLVFGIEPYLDLISVVGDPTEQP